MMKIDRSAWERTLNHNHFGAERANPGALALGEVFGNRVFRECVRDVVVDWCEGVEYSDFAKRHEGLVVKGRVIRSNDQGVEGEGEGKRAEEGVGRLRIRSETWLDDKTKYHLLKGLSNAWGLCLGTCRCGESRQEGGTGDFVSDEDGSGTLVNHNEEEDGDEDTTPAAKTAPIRHCEERWPRLEWSFWGKDFTVQKNEWRVLPNMSENAWGWLVYPSINIFWPSSPSIWQGEEKKKGLIKMFQKSGSLDTEDDMYILGRMKREKVLKRRKELIRRWPDCGPSLDERFGLGLTDSEEDRRELETEAEMAREAEREQKQKAEEDVET